MPAERTWVLTAGVHRDEAAKQLPELPGGRIVGEPCGRDTAAAVGLGAHLIAREDPEAVMMVMPADHLIEPAQEFRRAAQAAEQTAEDHPDALITFGIKPTFGSTNYGYIQRGESVGQKQGVGVYEVKHFKEKPIKSVADEYVASGEYYWNSGIFVWKVKTILSQLETHRPELCAGLGRIATAWGTPEQESVFHSEFEKLEKVSIDYAVMERAPKVLVLEAPYRWDDVGSWLALERCNPQDADGNTVQANHEGIGTSNCVIVSDADHLVTTIGVKDLIIIQDGNATLVVDRNDEAAVKQVVERLREKKLDDYL